MTAQQHRGYSPDFIAAKRELSQRLLAGWVVGTSRHLEKRTKGDPMKNVVGVGIARKRVGRKKTRTWCIRFLVEKKLPKSQLSKGLLPKTIAGIPTDVVEVGQIKLIQGALPDPRTSAATLYSGCSIGHLQPPAQSTAGTLGAFVSRGGKTCLLSNTHVIGVAAPANPGPPIYHPSPLHAAGGRVVARLTARRNIDFVGTNRVDAAVAEIIAPFDANVPGLGTVAGVGVAREGERVAAFCAGSRKIIRGVIDDVRDDLVVPYGNGSAVFEDQIAIKGLNGGGFGVDGDSGAMVLDSSLTAVGLLFCAGAGMGWANHLSEVLAVFGAQLIR
jgi:hypothetical protein